MSIITISSCARMPSSVNVHRSPRGRVTTNPIVCLTGAPPRRRVVRTGGNGDDDKNNNNQGGDQQDWDTIRRDANRLITLNSTFYFASTLTPQYFVQRIVMKWGKPCKATLIRKNGHIVLRIHLDETVSLPAHFSVYDDLCYRINTWNCGLAVLQGISAAPGTYGTLESESLIDMLYRMAGFGDNDNSRVYDIQLNVPVHGVRTSEFMVDLVDDIPEQ